MKRKKITKNIVYCGSHRYIRANTASFTSPIFGMRHLRLYNNVSFLTQQWANRGHVWNKWLRQIITDRFYFQIFSKVNYMSYVRKL